MKTVRWQGQATEATLQQVIGSDRTEIMPIDGHLRSADLAFGWPVWDSLRHAVSAVAVGDRPGAECRLVAVLSLDHDVFVHVDNLVTTEPFSASTRYE
jgi:hypothetical protein